MPDLSDRWVWTHCVDDDVLRMADEWYGFGKPLTRGAALRVCAHLEAFSIVRVVPPTDDEARALALSAAAAVCYVDEFSGADADLRELCSDWWQPKEWAPFDGLQDEIVAAVALLIEPVIKQSLLCPVAGTVERHIRNAQP